MRTLSLVMIVRNEERLLGRCLESVHALVDDIIIVDTGSTDGTKQIAAQYGASVYDFVWNNNFAEARNFALQQSTSDWNMVLDADEYISGEAAHSIRNFIAGERKIGKFRIVNKIEEHDEVSYVRNFISRIFPKNVYYLGRIHEQLDSDLPREILPVEVQHDGYYQTNKFDRNIPLLELELIDDANNSYLLHQLAKEYKGQGHIDPAYQYIKRAYQLLTRRESYAPLIVVDYLYIIMKVKGFTEGLEIMIAEQSFLEDYADFHFVSGLFYLDLIISDPQRYLHFLPRIEQSYRRCLEIGETDKYDSVVGTGSFAALHNLGVFYEVQGNQEGAIECYQKAGSYHYEPSISRLKAMGIKY